jgi:hypothetical protein
MIINKDMYHQKRPLISIAACAVCLLTMATCGGDSPSETSSNDTGITAVVGTSGGVVEVLDTESSIYGARAVIPAGALSGDTSISIEPASAQSVIPSEYVPAGGYVKFGPDGTVFKSNIKIYLPYNDRNNDGIIDGTAISENSATAIYFNENEDSWEDVTVSDRDTEANLVIAETNHFSTYLTPVPNPGTGGGVDTGNELQPGEYFFGKPLYSYYGDGTKELVLQGCIGQDYGECSNNGTCRQCGNPYVLTVRAEITENGNEVVAVIDRNTTTSGGYPARVSQDGTSATIDIGDLSKYFPLDKVHNSGSAEKWEWRCEYVTGGTNLNGYKICDENSDSTYCDGQGNKITCSIQGSGTIITINFGIDLSDHTISDKILFPTPNSTIGSFGMLAIAFEGWYTGP